MWMGSLPVLVGNNRVYSRYGFWLVITFQEIPGNGGGAVTF